MRHSAVLTRTASSSETGKKRDTDFSVKGIIGGQETSSGTSFELESKQNHNWCTNGGKTTSPAGAYKFTMDDILQYFFGKANHLRAHKEEDNGLCCVDCQQKTSERCPMHGPLQSLCKLVNNEKQEVEGKENAHVTYAVSSFPPEVQLCESQIPGHFYGVCARQFIPIGTWIGPYEGIRVSAEDTHEGMDMSYMWEVYKDGRISSYLDGGDENASSWMRFIRCARHKHEQNLFLFQYGDNIFYRAYKEIPPGTELLVWYDEQYEKFLGVPICLRHVIPVSIGQVYPHDMNLSTKDTNYPPSFYVPPTQPLHCDTGFPGKASPSNNLLKKSPRNECKEDLTKISGIKKNTADKKDAASGRTSPRENTSSLESGVWRCGQCFKSFTQRSLLQIHVCPRLPEKPYQCGHCSQSFSHPTELRTHVVTHNSERPFKCGFCGRSFAGSTTLNNHIRTHTGQKPFVCEKCARSFSQASQLSRHQRLPGDCHRNTVY
ncbi:putative histone-lysine N-methyltransferase PRDM6 [Dendronephthya gigantea]|uniref:putative histone-lysine N-methyltransferase PRDM6 n=1 Tax=Dendronephthya gigantea TaxID=151771 RepID=UPI00106D6724|nr:putative histone-lysine N-methyltransferase PRDM6 [Dendronephthya gigantea]